uniref:flagellar hook-associated protein FlgK n=3 Tax=Polynucleobacter sp. TaxID=2029855 RepID=UPI0040481771
MADILSIAQSGLHAAQAGINTTGQNIANVSTPGYSRQVVEQQPSPSVQYGLTSVGQGTNVTGINRIYSEFLAVQANTARTTSSNLATQSAEMQPINNLLTDSSSGLSTAVLSFFNKLQDLSSKPSDTSTRQTVISASQNLVARFNDAQKQLTNVNGGLNLQIKDSVTKINEAASQIASLNQQIAVSQTSRGGSNVNGLLDQRDQVVANLSKQIKLTVNEQDGNYNIMIGNGVPLVLAFNTYKLETVASKNDPTRLNVTHTPNGGAEVDVSDVLLGGSLGGIFDFRKNILNPTQNTIGQIILAITSDINAVNKTGLKANGIQGGNIFTQPASLATPYTTNTGSGGISIAITNTNLLTNSDYILEKTGAGDSYKLTRVSDGADVYSNSALATITNAGFSLSISTGTVSAGDQFLLRPTYSGASSYSVTATISDIATAAVGTSVQPDPVVAPAPGDNSNVLAMLAKQTSLVMNGGLSSYQDTLGGLISTVGNKSAELKATSAYAEQWQQSSSIAMENYSGINLEEEAANLLRYQQAYQASGTVLQMARQMFDSILGIMR